MTIRCNPDHPGAPVHPGEMLREEFMVPLGVSVEALALVMNSSAARITEIVSGKRGINADAAQQLKEYFGMPTQFWMDLQRNYDSAIGYSKEHGGLPIDRHV